MYIYKICGYKDTINLWDDKGGYLNGHIPTKEEKILYFDAKKAFSDQHPVPVKLVNYCAGDYPMYIVAISKSCLSCSRGNPESFDLSDLIVLDDDIKILIEFCEKYCRPKDEF